MRIGIDGRRIYGSGVGRATSNLIEGLLDFDHSNDYFLFINRTEESKKGFFKGKNAEVVECEIPFFSKKDLYEFPNIVKSKKIDIFLSLQFYISPFFKCPSVKMVHDLWPLLHPEWLPTQVEFISNFGKESFTGALELVEYFKKRYEGNLIFPQNEFIRKKIESERIKNTHFYVIAMMALTLDTAWKVIVPSLHTRKEIHDIFPEVIDKVEVVPNFPAPVFSYRACRPKPNYLLYVSKWDPRKNIHTMIKTVEILRLKYKECRLIMVGDLGYRKYGQKIMDLISKAPYKDFIIYLGVLEDKQLAELYQLAHIFFFPSLYEGFGIPVLEAMASGLPVVTSNLTALPEICGNAALLVDPRNPYKIAEVIGQILSDDELYNKLRVNGLARVKCFDRTQIIRRFISIFEEVALMNPPTNAVSTT